MDSETNEPVAGEMAETKPMPRSFSQEKQFYKVGEVSEMTGLEAHVLRFWEGEFDALSPRKNRAGHRIYNLREIALIEKIKTLVYDRGFTLAGAKKQLAANPQEAVEQEAGIEVKRLISREIAEIKSMLQVLVKSLDEDK